MPVFRFSLISPLTREQLTMAVIAGTRAGEHVLISHVGMGSSLLVLDGHLLMSLSMSSSQTGVKNCRCCMSLLGEVGGGIKLEVKSPQLWRMATILDGKKSANSLGSDSKLTRFG